MVAFSDSAVAGGEVRLCDYCDNEALKRSNLCGAHQWRKKHGMAMGSPVAARNREASEAVFDAYMALYDVDSEDDTAWQRAKWRAQQAVSRLVCENVKRKCAECPHRCHKAVRAAKEVRPKERQVKALVQLVFAGWMK